MFEAARFGDEISHTSALGGFLIGAALGIALVATVAIATFTCGFGVALLAGLAAGIGGSLLTAAGEAIGSMFSSPSGTITTASPNVFINSRKAARVEKSIGACDKHPGPVQIAEGSTNVFINSVAAARKGDKLTCGATISGGSDNVIIGGGTYRYLPVDDEIPEWLRTTVDVLMAIAGAAGGIAQLIKAGTQAGMKAIMPCALKFTAGFVAGEVASRYVVEPVARRAIGGLVGNPVDLTTGRKLIPDEIDFSLPGLMPIEWSRFYASDLTVDSVLGRGWVLPWEQSLRRQGSFIYLTDNQGREIPFVTLQPGQRIYNPHEQVYLVCTEGGHYILQTLDNLFFYFGEVPDTNSEVPLQRIENALGHFLHFTRTPDGTLTDISATGGTRVHLHYDNPLGRLTDIKRVVNNEAVETLTQYRYDEHGQLSAVINRNGDTVRSFSYAEGLMVTHSNALGLGCHYRWETLGDKPRVVEHWTSDGEHYHFRYDLDARTSWATDVLGRELEVQYNADHRVLASRDYGGERYAIELDEQGNMVGLDLPDGNRLAFKYDEYARLLEETDPLGRKTTYEYHHLTTLVTQVSYPDGSTWRARYDDKGNLLAEFDALGQMTEYLNSDDGLPHTIIDATYKSKYLWWNTLAQVERYQDCSGKSTWYRYDERQHLVAVTDALNQTTTLERKPDGEVLRISHPDGTAETFTYNVYGQVISHTDGKGQTTRLMRTARGLPSSRQDAKGQRVRYEYDKAVRLIALVNENNATYRFAYDASDRLSEEVRVDNLTRRFSYNVGGHLTRLDEIGYGENAERPERHTLFERDTIGRLVAKINRDARQDYAYDDGDRLLSIERQPTGIGKQLGITEEKLEYAYDLLGRLTKEITPDGTLGYEYDPLGNLTTLTLPDGRKVNHLYYGSGHLHQLNLDGQVISDMERDDLHREVYRTQGKLTSCFGYDAMGRKAWQFASNLPADKLSQVHNTGINTSLLVEHAYNPIHRRYQYDPAGELVRTLDKLRGEIKYEYEANGQLRSRDTGSLVGSEEFRYDAAANRLDFNARQFDKVKDNRIKQWRDQEYRYDPWGNLIEKRSGHSKLQSFAYDCENRLVRAETLVNGKLESRGDYRYDSLGRRVAKQAEINGEVEQKRFLWQGLRMLREETPGQSILYLYEPGSYAPLARVDQAEGEEQKVYYFHTDQIGTPLELTDSDGKIVWQATYRSWGAIDGLLVKNVEQNIRFQGQYFDSESGLNYNVFRYYDPELGRFIGQDPIGLQGGDNLYRYSPNPIKWVDPLGLMPLANPVSVGHHMVPHSLATSLGITPFNSFNNVPSMFWLESGQWNEIEHSAMHGYNGIGAGTKPAVTMNAFKAEGLTNEKWLQSLEAHYNNPELANLRGDLRIIENGNPGRIIAANVSPAEAWEATKKWARSQGAAMPGCS
ncbi:RHS repeat-associated core domain-containing protein [Pseudomonas asiatica]|uniref:RHS repeat-associated core domain-containing protein n=14 Tax=Pseudomonas TaxID=286 RepID=UPI0025A241A0|nr:RHS repeat-associated core domain-containing protein [Pseudomonas asiatica]MDM9588791.1 RHS repeat-associated core domain-containing protein [Pseudomonas asiatica]WJM51111.1 RHS repeat-associated core domain-containing protein [Pseudomonas asiatica]